MTENAARRAQWARVAAWQLWHFTIGEGEQWEIEKDEGQNPRLIGTYSSEALAVAAAESLRAKPGFRDWPAGFRVLETWLNQTGWEEGFITFEEAWEALEDSDNVTPSENGG